MGFNFIVIVPSPHHLVVASPLSLDVGYLFLVGSSILLSMVVQKLVGALTGDGHTSCPARIKEGWGKQKVNR